MLNHHHETVTRLASDHSLRHLIRDHLRLPIAKTLPSALLDRGLGQADLVLCLLRIRDAHTSLRTSIESYIAALIGHAIHACPPCLQHYNAPSIAKRSPRITHVSPVNPRQEGTDAYMRWHEFRVGRTIEQLHVRGITNKDIRRCVRNGWIKVEEMA